MAAILVVDDDAGIRRLVRTALELEGFTAIEAATLAQARSVEGERVDGVVLDRQLPDGDGLAAFDEMRSRFPGAIVVLHSSAHIPQGYPSVPKGDVAAIVERFGGGAGPVVPVRPPDVARAVADLVVEEWVELCRWDPELPVESRPPIAGSVVAAVANALERPQPLGWGLDPALEPVAEAYLLNHQALDVAVAQLVCLREAFERRVVDGLRPVDQLEAARRLTMIIQRLTTVVVRTGVATLQAQAFTDPVTGLGNARAYQVDLTRERDRARRHQRPLSVVRVAATGLDIALGGEEVLRRFGAALSAVPGTVHAYHLGLGDFALLLPDTVAVDDNFVVGPLGEARVGNLVIGIATSPPDDLDQLDQMAERRRRDGSPIPLSQRARREGGLDL